MEVFLVYVIINEDLTALVRYRICNRQRLRMTLVGRNSKSYHPNECFSVSLEDAMEVAKRIIDGSIVKYRMDNTTGRLAPKVALA